MAGYTVGRHRFHVGAGAAWGRRRGRALQLRQELAEALPNSRFKLDGAGHNVLVASGETAKAAVLDWLRQAL